MTDEQEPRWLHPAMIRAVHERQIVEHGGGSTNLRDDGSLESALTRPRMKWTYGEREIPVLGAAYTFGIARNHPFIDGNKRIAHISMRTFLKINGWILSASADEKYRIIMQLAAGELTEDQLADWLRSHAKPSS